MPGRSALVGERRVYQENPSEFFALARWKLDGQPKPGSTGNLVAPGDMALSVFKSKPIEFPAASLKRVTEAAGRVWVRGNVRVSQGVAEGFVANYVSQTTDASNLAPSSLEADAVQAAVLMSSFDDGSV